MPAYSFLDLACDVLKTSPIPLTYQEIWQLGSGNGLTAKIRTSGKAFREIKSRIRKKRQIDLQE